MSGNITTNYSNLEKTDFQPFINKPLFNKGLNSVSPSTLESINQNHEVESKEEGSSILSKIGYVLSYPFVKIYQLFNDLIWCCCKPSNLFERFEKNPERTADDFVKDPVGCFEKLFKDFESDPEKAGEIIGRVLSETKKAEKAQQTKVKLSLFLIYMSLLSPNEIVVNSIKNKIEGGEHTKEGSEEMQKLVEQLYAAADETKMKAMMTGLFGVLLHLAPSLEALDTRPGFLPSLAQLAVPGIKSLAVLYKEVQKDLYSKFPDFEKGLEKLEEFLNSLQKEPSIVTKFLKGLNSSYKTEDLEKQLAPYLEKIKNPEGFKKFMEQLFSKPESPQGETVHQED